MLGLSTGHKKARITVPQLPAHLSQSQLADCIVEFLEPYVHYVLFLRKARAVAAMPRWRVRSRTMVAAQVYPGEVFDEPCLAHGVPVRRCPNAQLCEYVREHLSSPTRRCANGSWTARSSA